MSTGLLRHLLVYHLDMRTSSYFSLSRHSAYRSTTQRSLLADSAMTIVSASHTYGLYASSANAANTFVRSIVASIFPVVAHSIIDNLGTKWGISLFGFLSLGLIPIPLIFIRYGASLRERSFFVQEAHAIVTRMRGEESEGEYEEPEEKTGEVQVIPRDSTQKETIPSDSLEVPRTHHLDVV